jgi:hypothetical protein
VGGGGGGGGGPGVRGERLIRRIILCKRRLEKRTTSPPLIVRPHPHNPQAHTLVVGVLGVGDFDVDVDGVPGEGGTSGRGPQELCPLDDDDVAVKARLQLEGGEDLGRGGRA